MPLPAADEFSIVHSVPIVDTFSDRGVVLDDQFLDDMIADANKRQMETNDMPPVIVGHNPDEPVPEIEKPPVIGFVRNLRKEPLGKTGRNAAVGDLWIYKEHADKLKQFPRRSAELFPTLKRLDALAVLGATPPQRDLGLTATLPLKLKREVSVEPEVKPAEEPKGFAEIKAMLEQVISLLQGQAGKMEPAGPADEDEELEKLLAELGGEAEPEAKPEPEAKEKEEEEVKLSRRLAELEGQVARAELREQLTKLQRDGIVVDVEAETAELAKLDPETRKIMLSRIEKNYAKAPIQTKPLAGLEGSKGSGESKTLSEPERQKILALSRKTGSYETAFAEVMGATPDQYFKGTK